MARVARSWEVSSPIVSASGQERCCGHCCPCVKRRWVLSSAFVFSIAALIVLLCVVPSYIVQSRLDGASVTLADASMVIRSTTTSMVEPQLRIRAPESLLELPFSFTATIHPFSVDIFTELNSSKWTSRQVHIGVMHINQDVTISSGSDVDMSVTGQFEISGVDYLPKVLRKFLFLEMVDATVSATIRVSAKIWGWIPCYFPAVAVQYKAFVPGIDSFKQHVPQLYQITAANGRLNNFEAECSALLYNPSPMNIVIDDNLSLRVGYKWKGVDYVVGVVTTKPGFTILTGMNLVDGLFTVQQTPKNSEAITGMITSYIGGTQKGFSNTSNKPFLVSWLEDDDQTTNSPFMRQAMKGLNVSFNFRPMPIAFLKAITADITVGGSILKVGWFYSAIVHVLVNNPLPTQVRVKSLWLEAFHKSLSGAKLYRFDRTHGAINPNDYVIPAGKDVLLSFTLKPFTEVFLGAAFKELRELAKAGLNQKISVGVDVKMTLIADPAYEQDVHYKNDEISGTLCYHVLPTKRACGFSDTDFFPQVAPGANAEGDVWPKLLASML